MSAEIRAIARALGGDVIGRDTVAAPGPGHSRKDRSLVVKLNPSAPDGFVVHSHAGDDWDVCKDYVRARLGWPSWQPDDGRDRRVNPSQLAAIDRAAVEAEIEQRERTEDDWRRIKRAHALWSEAANPHGTAAEQYLRSRALVISDDIAGNVLRYHPACPWRNENTGGTDCVPALLAAFTSFDDNTITAVHRIRLDQPERWPKAERRMLGPVHRTAVKLDAASDTLAVGEGVETCMAARQLGHKPAWALGSAGMIAKFPVLEGIERLRILGETGTTSAEAIKFCGDRWHRAGRRVQIVMPDIGSDDLNDELMKAATA